MSYTIAQLKNDLEGILHGTTLNQVTNLDNLIDRASRQILLDVDPQETKRIVNFPDPIFESVYDYPCPSDLKGNKVIDIRPQVNRSVQDNYSQTYNKTFDLTKSRTLSPEFTINFNTGLKTIRMANPQLISGIMINAANTIASDGTWSVGGNASTLSQDDVNYVSNGSSLKFNLIAGADPSTGYLENSTMSQVDLSELENQGTLFLYTYMPTPSSINSVTLRWGSSSTDYWESTATVTQQATVFQVGWNLLSFNWLGATSSGSPDSSEVDYLRVTWNYDGDLQTGMRLDNISASLGTIMEIEYYSKFFFRDFTTGAFQETVTDDSNLINLDTDTYNLLTYQAALLAVQQQAGSSGGTDLIFFNKAYTECLARYKKMYKSEITKPKDSYYVMPQTNYRRWFGGRM